MGKFSTYRYLELKDEGSSSPYVVARSRTLKQPRGLKKVFILLVVVALVVTYLLGIFASQTQWFDGLAKSLGYESVYHHAVVIDAGSSGSRVLAYMFRVPFTVFGPANLELEQEYFQQSKPGLSAFANEPDKGAGTILKLLEEVEFFTSEEQRKETPLLVRATAGLRLLPADTASRLLDAVRSAVGKLGYNTTNNSVQIMEGHDEGIYIWYTLNLLHNLMGIDTMAALDLGGGSTQITYQLAPEDAPKYPAADLYEQYVPAEGKNITLYTHSYLNLGLLAARYGVFKLEAGASNSTKAASESSEGTQFTSVCVDPIIQKEPWTYANIKMQVSGAERGSLKQNAVYRRCHALVRRYVMANIGWEPPAPPRGRVAAMSFFYDVAADAGLIDVMTGGIATVSAYRRLAVSACSSGNVEQPWACIDLVYIVALLQDAYKIADEEPISLFKQINGHEVSWALGLAYTTIMKRITQEP